MSVVQQSGSSDRALSDEASPVSWMDVLKIIVMVGGVVGVIALVTFVYDYFS